MLQIFIELCRQRMNYLLHGNVHGVSIGWILKNGADLADISQFLVGRGHQILEVESLLLNARNYYSFLVSNETSHDYSSSYNSESELACLLYALIFLEKPLVMVETGVANGITTNMILKATEEVGGTLHSFDIDANVKKVYQGNADWRLHIINPKQTKTQFQKEMKDISNVDVWIHDSNHGFWWQYFEYSIALKSLRPKGSMLISDDIDASTAWCTFLKKHNFKSKAVFDSRKIIGIFEK